MITEALLNLLFGLIGNLLDLLPVLDFPWVNSIADGFNNLFEFLSKANQFLPVTHVFIVLGAITAVPTFKFIFFVINWIIRRIADVIP